MAQKDPTQIAQKWVNNLSASGDSIRAGVNAVTTAPGAAAARQKELYVSRVRDSADKWAANVGRVSLGDWQTSMIEKGLARIAGGAQAAQPKMQQFLSEFLPHVERVAQQVRAMPKGNLDASIARATAQIRGNAAFRRSGS